MRTQSWMGRAAGVALLGGMLGACDFIDIAGSNPNIISEPRIDQLWVGAQVNSYLIAEGQIARVAAVWTQQLAGTDRQFSLLDTYEFTENELDGEFSSIYTGGGIVDLRRGKAQADTAQCAACKGLFQIHEAFLAGTAASIFGAIPFSEAGDLTNFPTPRLDPQEQVYAAIQAELDSAIAGLTAGPGAGAATYAQLRAADFNFGALPEADQRARWIAVAYTLKARYYMHWVEAQRAGGASAALAQTACAGDCVAKAIAAAQNGITSPAGNWRGIHSSASTENNLFFQFFRDRAGYISAGAFLVNTLQSRNDPRLGIYFEPSSGTTYTGSAPGENNSGVSQVSSAAGSPGSAEYDQPIVSCAERNFILAEAYFYQGATGAAQDAMEAGVACQEQLFDVSIDVNTELTGAALLDEIILQKYIALFLNHEVYNDYKRTCRPALATYQGQAIPRRLLYGRSERQTNPNIPSPDQQPVANANDPNGCTSGAGA